MIKTSSLIPFQLPSFIRDDDNYQTFITFLEAYYEWMEQEKGVLYENTKLLDYIDVDNTLDEFIDYFYNSFLPSFPVDVITDKRKLLRFSKELYENKGNRASYKFLFRALYNVDSDLIETKEFVLKASAGKWFLPKSIKIKSNDSRWVNAEKLWVFGNNSKSFAKIERVKIVNDRIELFLSDIERLFETGEFVKIVTQDLRDIYFDVAGNIVDYGTPQSSILEAKLLGTISNVLINNKYRGNYYLSGDPVVVYGGMDDEVNGIGAVAEVGEVTLGAIQRVKVENGSWGYREHPNTFIYVTPDSGKPILTVGAVNPANTINVNMMVMDSLELKENIPLNCNTQTGFVQVYNPAIQNYYFNRTNSVGIIANANTRMIDAFTFKEFPTYSIDSVIVQNGGGGFRVLPTVEAVSMYETDLPFNEADAYDPRYRPVANTVTSIKNFGILGPILFRKDANGNEIRGTAYKANDEIIFTGGLGGGAFARITSVHANGAINAVSYYTSQYEPAPLGGFGYTTKELPSLSTKQDLIIGDVVTGNTKLIITSYDTTRRYQDYADNTYFYWTSTQDSEIYNNFTVNQYIITAGQEISGPGVPQGTTIISYNSGNNTIIMSNSAVSNTTSNSYYIGGHGAEMYISTVLGDSARLVPITDRIGAITTIKVTNYGEDYTSKPNVSLKVQDIAVANVNILYLPQKGDIVYQGANTDSFTYKAYVDSITRMTYDAEQENSTYLLRVYNYNKSPVHTENLILYKPSIQSTQNTFNLSITTDYVFPEKVLADGSRTTIGKNGILTYGDGTAKANTQFLNGLILGQGRYIDNAHQPSSFSLLQDENYNNFTYIVSVEKEITKYKDIIYKLLHPAGTKVIGQALLKNEADASIDLVDTTYVNKLDDFEFIWAALATEESDVNDFTSELMRFPEPIKKYGTLTSNNSNILTISTFPDIYEGQRIYGSGIPWGSKISNVYLNNTSIRITNTCSATQNDVTILAQDFWNDHNELFATQYEVVSANTTENSNIITINTKKDDPLADIIPDQYVVCDPVTIYANTINSNNKLINVQSLENISIGQYISGNNIPNGTTVTAKFTNNNTIIMSQNATANANGVSYSYYDKSTGAKVNVYKYNYIQFQSISSNTKITKIVNTNNSVVLSNTSIKGNNDIVYYFLGEGNQTKDSESPSEFVRVELGQFQEKYVPSEPKDSSYFSYTETVLLEDGSVLSTENDLDVISTIYIKIK